MRKTLLCILLLVSITSFSQRRESSRIDKSVFIHTWKLDEIRNRTNDLLTNKVKNQEIRFTNDSVFITNATGSYSGTWTFINNIQINIKGTTQFNYKWTIIGDHKVCFRIGENMSRFECYKQID